MKKIIVIVLFIAGVLVYFKAGDLFGILNRTGRGTGNLTITSLPELPSIPLGAQYYSKEKQKELVMGIIDSKLATYPGESGRGHRVGKFTGTGVHTEFGFREDQIKKLAVSYDANSLNADQKNFGILFKKYNPGFKLFMYIDSGIHPENNYTGVGSDVGNIDDENIDWILQYHPDWLLKDSEGNPLRSGDGTLSLPGEYWPDPGNKEFQEWFGKKVKKAIALSGDRLWDGILIDQFFGIIDNYTNYAGANQQTKYKTDGEFQKAQIDFVKRVREIIGLPIITNLDGGASVLYPEFFVELGRVAGGIESEILPFENSDENNSSYMPEESVKELLDAMLELPKNIHIRINAKPGGMAGNIDRTLYAYYIYLLVADRDRQIHWTSKEGDASVPHYWFKEFDLDLGLPMGEMMVLGDFRKESYLHRDVLVGDLWERRFDNATLIVNPRHDQDSEYRFSGVRYNILGESVTSPLVLNAHTGLLLFPDQEALKRALLPLK